MGAPEAYVEDYLVRRCKTLGILCWKFTTPGTSGVPDRIVVHNGQVVFIETKRPGARLRVLQEKRREQLTRAGATVIVADTREIIDDLLATLIEGDPL